MNKMKYITLSKEAFPEVVKMLESENLVCKFCGIGITAENFGYIGWDVHACNNIFCLMHAIDEEEQHPQTGDS